MVGLATKEGFFCNKKVSQYWQVAIVGGKVPNLEKSPRPKHRCEVYLSTYYFIHFSQYAHPMGSGRPACRLYSLKVKCQTKRGIGAPTHAHLPFGLTPIKLDARLDRLIRLILL